MYIAVSYWYMCCVSMYCTVKDRTRLQGAFGAQADLIFLTCRSQWPFDALIGHWGGKSSFWNCALASSTDRPHYHHRRRRQAQNAKITSPVQSSPVHYITVFNIAPERVPSGVSRYSVVHSRTTSCTSCNSTHYVHNRSATQQI